MANTQVKTTKSATSTTIISFRAFGSCLVGLSIRTNYWQKEYTNCLILGKPAGPLELKLKITKYKSDYGRTLHDH